MLVGAEALVWTQGEPFHLGNLQVRSFGFGKDSLQGRLHHPGSKVDKEVWLAFDEKGNERSKGSLVALLVTYVDDLFFLGNTAVVELLDGWVRKEWPCSKLQWADKDDGAAILEQKCSNGSLEPLSLSKQATLKTS